MILVVKTLTIISLVFGLAPLSSMWAASSSSSSYHITSSAHVSGGPVSSASYNSQSVLIGDIGAYLSSGKYNAQGGFVGVYVAGSNTLGFSNWASGLSDTSQLGDPDRDGIVNLIEYAFGLQGDRNDSIATVIVHEVVGSVMSIRYSADTALTDITYQAEWSDDLASWSTAGILELVESTSGSVEYRVASISMPPSGRLFLRIKLILN